jgi:hypothetical protein
VVRISGEGGTGSFGYGAACPERRDCAAITPEVSPMSLNKHLLLLVAVALLTPVAAIMGLYDSSMEQMLSFLGPVAGAAGALFVLQLLRKR